MYNGTLQREWHFAEGPTLRNAAATGHTKMLQRAETTLRKQTIRVIEQLAWRAEDWFQVN